jgi:hypothetical protein
MRKVKKGDVNMKKVILVLAAICLLFTTAGPAAAKTLLFAPATVNQAGVFNGDADYGYTIVNATSTSSPPKWTGARWFVSTGSGAKAVLAGALAAEASGRSVQLIVYQEDLSATGWLPVIGLVSAPQ